MHIGRIIPNKGMKIHIFDNQVQRMDLDYAFTPHNSIIFPSHFDKCSNPSIDMSRKPEEDQCVVNN